jgi:hypothetical protein
VSIDGTPGPPRSDIRCTQEVLVDNGEFEPNISNLKVPSQRRPSTEQQTRLECLESDGAIRSEHAARDHPREGIDATRYVDCEHRRCPDIRRGPLTSKASAIGGVDDEVGKWQYRWQRSGVEYFYLHATSSKCCCGHASVCSVVAFASNHDSHTTIATAQQNQGTARDSATCSTDQFIDVFRSRGVDCRHLTGRQHREHCCNLCGQ